MSMINDALKRAQQSQTPNPPSGPPPLPPVEARGGRSPAWIVILAVIMFSGGMAGFFFAQKYMKKSAQPLPATTNAAPVVVVKVVTNLPPPPPPAPSIQVEWPRVQSILYNDANPMAIINKKTVAVGDRLGNFKVKAISHASVTLEYTNGLSKEIPFGK